MKPVTTLEERRRWMEHWHRAAIALEEMKRFELRMLTDADAWRQINALQSISGVWRDPEGKPGLLEQQALFRKLR